MRYDSYESVDTMPNVVVDGSPNAATVLCLTHWPAIPDTAGVADDLSAQMAFRYVDAGMGRHDDATIVTNNHYDQDGIVSIYVLVEPDAALAARDLLIDVAAAGDFGTYRDRRAARIAWVLAAWATSTDIDDPFVAALDRLPHLLAHVDEYRPLWEAEDTELAASEAALAAGSVRVDADAGPWSGSRFVGQRFDGVHPMAVHNATDMSGIALVHGHRYQYTDRYETWVQYVSRARRSRVDLRPLAHRLTTLDDVEWRADAAGALAPTLAHDGNSSLSPETFVGELRDHLCSAPAAWDPYASRDAEPDGAMSAS